MQNTKILFFICSIILACADVYYNIDEEQLDGKGTDTEEQLDTGTDTEEQLDTGTESLNFIEEMKLECPQMKQFFDDCYNSGEPFTGPTFEYLKRECGSPGTTNEGFIRVFECWKSALNDCTYYMECIASN